MSDTGDERLDQALRDAQKMIERTNDPGTDDELQLGIVRDSSLIDRTIHTIPSDLPAEACHWPACADPVCERNENGTCPLRDEIVVECNYCGAARALGRDCPVCNAEFVPNQPSDGDGEAAHAVTAAPPPARGPNTRAHRKVVIVDDDATVIRLSALRGLYAVAGDMRTLAEALGVSPSTVSRALAGDIVVLERDDRIRAVRQLLGTEEGS